MDPAFKYWAFISYSHADKLPGDWLRRRTWGEWLHQELEGYRVPPNLVGRAGRDGPVPKRILPVFRDRDELPTSADLTANISSALAQSRCLIVICSPRAAHSRWVNEEVVSFKALGRANRILCLIVDGEPNASDRPGAEAQECFPPAVRFRVAPDRTLTSEHVEPIAADARPGADGRGNSRLKLIAGLLGLNYDDLRQREKRRVFWRRVRLAVGGVVMAGLLSGVWQWQEERVHQKRLEGYLESGRKEWLDEHPAKALAYLSRAYTEGSASPALRFLLHQARLALPNVSADRHTGRVFAASFSPDGQRVVTACDDHYAKIWDAPTGRLRATLEHTQCVNSAVFSPDGKTIVTACDDGFARIWDASATGLPKPLAALALKGKLFPAVFNREGTLLAAASQEGTAMVWHVPGYTAVGGFNEHTEAINSLEFSPDGKLIVTASSDRTARIWDARTREQQAVLQPHDSLLIHASFSPDGTRVVTCTQSGEAGLWRRDGTLITRLEPRHQNLVRRAFFSPDGRLLVTASKDGTARVWNGEDGRFLYPLNHVDSPESEQRLVFTVAFSHPDGRYLATAGQNGVVKIWDLRQEGRLVLPFNRHEGEEVIGVEFSPDGEFMSTAGGKGRAFIWDVTDMTRQYRVATLGGTAAVTGDADEGLVAGASLLRKLEGHTTYVTLARFSPDGRRVVSVDGPGRVRVWEPEVDDPLLLLESAAGLAVKDAAFDLNGRRLVTGDNNGIVSRWELTAGSTVTEPAQTFPAFTGPVRQVLFLPSQLGFVVAGEDRQRNADRSIASRRLVKFFELIGGAPRITLEGGNPVFSPDGKLLVTLNEGNLARLWTADGAPVATLAGHTAPLLSARFNADSQRLVTASDDGTAIIWDATGRRLLTLNGHGGNGLFFATFSPDGRQVMTVAGGKNPAKLWDALTGRELVTLEGEQQYTASPTLGNILPEATFSADGTLVAAQCFSSLVNVWNAASGRQLVRLKGHAGNLTAMAFAPNDARLLTGSADGSLRVWDMGVENETPEKVAEFVTLRGKWRLDEDGALVEVRPAKPPAK